MVRLYFDVHVPLTVAGQLSKRGIDVLTAQADNSAILRSSSIIGEATGINYVIGMVIPKLDIACRPAIFPS